MLTRLSSQLVAPTPIVSAEQVAGVTDAYLDRMADLARRLDVPAGAVGEVVRRAGVAMVDSCASEPETVGDILGRWAANIRTLATRVRTGTTTALPLVSRPADAETGDAAAVSGGEARATAAVLGGLDERRRLALLLRDSYDAPPGALAVALGVSATESETVVAESRLRLMEGINGRPAPTLAGHEVIAGVSLGTLGALADGSAIDTDPAVRLRRRHVGGCQACAAILDAQNRARVVMAGLPVLALADAARQPTLDAIIARADAGLLTADEVEAAVARDGRLLPTAVVGVALALALIIGVGVGAILRHAKTAVDDTPSPSSSGVILSTPSATATATTTSKASPSASPSLSSSPTPAFTRSFSPSAVPSTARATMKPKPKKTTAKPVKSAVTVTPSTPATVVSTAPTVAPTTAAPSTAPTTASAAPTSAAATPSAAASSSAPVIIPTR